MSRRVKILLSYLIPTLLLAAFAGLWICKFNQWDALTYITVIPFWILAIPGIVVSLVAAMIIRSQFCYVAFATWFLTALLVSAETRGLFRSAVATQIETRPDDAAGIPLKLASINCDSNIRAAHMALEIVPDILLLQESPDRQYLEELTWRLFGRQGSYIAGESNSLLGKGRFLTFSEDEATPTIHARFKHVSGVILDLTNLKLEQSFPQKELWKSEIRNAMRNNRVKNRKSVREFIGDYQPETGQPIRLVAGDFSTPPGDDIFRPVKMAGLRDAFRHSGRGTGNTYPGNFPMLRLDQAWISPEATLSKTYTMKCEFSDHQILVCEFIARKRR